MSRTPRTQHVETATPEDALLAAIIRQAVADYQGAVASHQASATSLLHLLGLLDARGHWTRRGRDWDRLISRS